MNSIVIEIINKFGYLGIILLITIENIFPPIPSEVILTFSGFATIISNITIIGAIIASTIGSVFGAILLYWVGIFLSKEKIYNFTKGKYGKLLRLKKENINKAFNWFDDKGKYAVFFGRFVPIVRSLVSIPAGMAKMAIIPFLGLTTLGSLMWNTALIILGRIAGESWIKVAGHLDNYSDIIIKFFYFLCVLAIIRFYFKKRKKVHVIVWRKK